MARRRGSLLRRWGLTGFVGAAGIALVVMVAGVPPYPAWLIGAGSMLFLFYGIDKQRAIAGGWRIPEAVLHGMALAGGFTGGWAGRILFRHKTRKPSFLLILVIATLLHVVALVLFS